RVQIGSVIYDVEYTRLASDAHRPAVHHTGPDLYVEKPHPGTQTGAPKGVAAIPRAGAEVEHPADTVVVSRRPVEQRADERLPVIRTRIVLLEDGMRRCRGGLIAGRVAPTVRILSSAISHQNLTGSVFNPLSVR